MTRSIRVGATPRIKVDAVGGDLSIIGWESEDLLIKADEDEIRLEQKDGEIALSTDDDLSLRIPKEAMLILKTVGGDAAIRGVTGDIELKEVGGDLSIREGGAISIDTVHADFNLRGAKKNLYVKNAHGDVSIRDVEGSVTLDSVADDLALRGARGNIKVNVGEDVVVYLDPKPDGEYAITAGEDILLVLPVNANAMLTLHADEIHVDWPGIEDEEDVTERVVTLGNGSARISLNAGGDVRVSNNAEAGESAEEFGNFAGLNFDWSGFGERISQKVEQATRRAQQRAEEAARRAERHAERQARHARHGTHGMEIGRWNWDFGPKGAPRPPGPPSPASSPSEPVSEEERMAILKMLEDKKITAEQAEQLLAALEGDK